MERASAGRRLDLSRVTTIIFDALGTVFEIEALIPLLDLYAPGRGEALFALWRRYQVEFSWLRTLMGRYVGWDAVTREALDVALASPGITLPAAARARLNAAWMDLPLYPDVRPTLERLVREYRVAEFSNATLAMLQALARRNSLEERVQLLSVEPARAYKPDPRVYALIPARLGVAREEVLYCTSPTFDAAGARNFGFLTVWLNRTGRPFDAPGPGPDFTIRQMTGLLDLLPPR